ncbi:MAG: dTDP-4-dehydrorhamnose reductase [Euryarchaeota archaeon]|nr:dTDP-4-dehydrorhamnose reductase [Euryarchaeota archaeon]MBU4139218.1 dTDP-4-dehydrorhamnose reductase [Euryarchaeota archaeon]
MVVGKIKTLIFGAGGMLGTELCTVFPDAVKLKHRDLDIRDREKVIETIETNKPDVVINAAGYTAVDDCEENRELAFDINGAAPGYIAQGCKRAGAILVHYSTDYIFDGSKKEYVESDSPNPVNAYGSSKLAGEMNIIENMEDHRIVRTSWLYGAHGRNFVDTMLMLSGKMDKVKVVNDQFGKPTYTADLARKTKELVGLPAGVYHITNEGVCSWYEFASAIIKNTVQCTSDEFPRKARRPKYSVLVNTKTTPMRHWRDALAEYLKRNEAIQ